MRKLDLPLFRKYMRMLERETGLLLSEETACCGVTVAQCHLLLEIEIRGPSSLQDLADALALDKSTLSRTADSLVREGFTERVQDERNRRKITLSLTSKGQEKCDTINSLCNAQYRALFAHIPEEKTAVVMEAVEILAHAMETNRSEGQSICCNP